MAKTLPDNLTKQDVIDLQEALLRFFPAEILGPGHQGAGIKSWEIENLKLSWNNPESFRSYVKTLTGTNDVVSANKTLESWVSIAPDKSTAQANRPSKGQLETFEAEAEKRFAAQQKAVADAKILVEAAIKRQTEIQNQLKAGQKLYVEARRIARPSTKEAVEAEQLVNALKTKFETEKHQRQMVDDVAAVIEEKLTPTLKKRDYNQSQIKDLSKKAAEDFVDVVNNPKTMEIYAEQAAKAAILGTVAVSSDTVPEGIREAAGTVAAIESAPIETSRDYIEASFGKGFGHFFGPTPQDFEVTVSAKPFSNSTHVVDYAQLNSGYGLVLKNQSTMLDSITGVAQSEAKSFLFEKFGGYVEGKIAQLPADSALAGLYNNSALRNALSLATGGPITISVDSSFVTGFATRIPGGMGTINAFGNAFGVRTVVTGGGMVAGAKAGAWAASTASTAANIATTQGVMASEAFLGGAGVAAGSGTGIVVGQLTIPIPVVGAAIGAALGWVGGKIAKIIPWQKIKKNIIPITATMLFAGLIFRNPFLSVFGGTGLGAGLLYGGFPFSNRSIRALNIRFARFGRVFGRAVAMSLGIPLLIFLVAIPTVTALILLIVNSGAYMVPPGDDLANSTNPYIDVQKKANPSGTLPSPQTIVYTVTITAKKDALKITSITPTCTVVKKNGGKVNCPPEDMPSTPLTINAGTPYTFTFTSNYDSKYTDALISDTVTVDASLPDGTSVSATGATSVCFGECPLDCFDLEDPSWGPVPDKKGLLTAAASQIAGKYPGFAAKACASGTIKLCYTTNNPPPGSCTNTYAIHFHGACDITFNKCGLGNSGDALYLLTHEATHHIQNISGGYLGTFINQYVPRSSYPICTYSLTGGSAEESMAEGAALYTGKPSWNSCVSNFQSQYPKHYKYDVEVLFKQ